MKPSLSIIVCTYNPIDSIFHRCINAIYKEASKLTDYQLLIIDNNSNPSILDQHGSLLRSLIGCNYSIVVEPKQGLTQARLTGIKKSSGTILCFIDDDNFVSNNYFIELVDIATKNPQIGAWSGEITLEYEVDPPEWIKSYEGLLVKRILDRDYWSNLYTCNESVPCGAGLTIRRNVGLKYLDLHINGHRSIQLDRSKNSLLSGGDNDLAFCAIDLGAGIGVFQRLKLVHYIPEFRTSKQYLLKLTKYISASAIILNYYRSSFYKPLSFKRRLYNLISSPFKSKIKRQFIKASNSGTKLGLKILAEQ